MQVHRKLPLLASSATLLVAIAIAPPAAADNAGIVGRSGKQGFFCEGCHVLPAGVQTTASLQLLSGGSGLDGIEAGALAQLRLTIRDEDPGNGIGGVFCGMNVGDEIGALQSIFGQGTRLATPPLPMGGTIELTHSTRKPFAGDNTCTFDFEWQAPSGSIDTLLYVSANSVDGNLTISGDSPVDFIQLIQVVPEPSSVLHGTVALLGLCGLWTRQVRARWASTFRENAPEAGTWLGTTPTHSPSMLRVAPDLRRVARTSVADWTAPAPEIAA